MAAIFPVSPLINFRRFTPYRTKAVTACKSVIKSVAGTTKVSVTPEPIVRRPGNYKPCMRDNNFLQSLKTDYAVILFSCFLNYMFKIWCKNVLHDESRKIYIG